MHLKQRKSPKDIYLLAFFLPLVSMLLLQLIAGAEPFGNSNSMLYSDSYHQYFPFFLEFHRALRSGDSLLYNWSVGMGMDYLSLISYYLASPLNLISVLLPESWVLEYFSLLMPLKLALASLFFTIFLHKIYGSSDRITALFGCFYGLCAWALGYQWNIMWLDTFALLPLMALGTVYLLRDRAFVLYTLTLFLSIFSNYYIGFFTCIFVLLLFLCYEICRWQGLGRFFRDFLRIGVFTLIAIGMTAVLELPALAGLQNTQSSVNAFPTTFRLNIVSDHTIKGLFNAMGQVAGNTLGGLTPTFKEGLPNLYCGVGSLMMAFLFLSAKDVKLRDKLCGVALLIFFMLSFIIRQLDYIWHGFHFTNMIPYRFSFLFSFVLLCMAYRAYQLRSQFPLWKLLGSAVLTLALIGLSQGWRDLLKESADHRDAWLFLSYNLGFLLFYLFIMVWDLPRKAHRTAEICLQPSRGRMTSTLLLLCMVLEIGLNVLNFGLRFSYTNLDFYPRGKEDTEACLEEMRRREADTLFYRAETTHSQTLNDGALNNYNGISTFTSSANVKVTEFMRALGYGAKNTYNRYCYEESSPVANLFLGIKYMIDREGDLEETDYFDAVFSSGKVTLLENNAYLPLGFLTRPELARLPFDRTEPFQFQNQLFTAATGILEDVWSPVLPQITTKGVTLISSGGYHCQYEKSEADSAVYYSFTADRPGFFCVDLDVTKRNKIDLYCNDQLLYAENINLPQMLSVCNVQPGDVVKVRLTCKADESGSMTVRGAILDGSLFRTGLELLQQSQLELTHFSNTRITGTIDCAHDGLIYTSVPQNGSWQVYLDGVQVEETLVGDVMIGVMAQQGPHELCLQYHNTAFSYGWKISLASTAALLICMLAAPRRKVGQYEAQD